MSTAVTKSPTLLPVRRILLKINPPPRVHCAIWRHWLLAMALGRTIAFPPHGRSFLEEGGLRQHSQQTKTSIPYPQGKCTRWCRVRKISMDEFPVLITALDASNVPFVIVIKWKVNLHVPLLSSKARPLVPAKVSRRAQVVCRWHAFQYFTLSPHRYRSSIRKRRGSQSRPCLLAYIMFPPSL